METNQKGFFSARYMETVRKLVAFDEREESVGYTAHVV